MIKDNLNFVYDSVDNLKSNLGINYNINLMVVSKTRTVKEILETINYGQKLFGENRVIEAYDKFNEDQIKNKNIDLHIIGHLQRNKVKKAIEIASMIQSIDKLDTLLEIEKEASKVNKKMEYLIEINTSNEIQKSGISPDLFENLLESIDKNNFKFCTLRGLMTVGPLTDDDNKVRESFKLLFNIFNKTKKIINNNNFDIISMGMSNDYKIAIEEGSNLIRIGSLIFGERLYK